MPVSFISPYSDRFAPRFQGKPTAVSPFLPPLSSPIPQTTTTPLHFAGRKTRRVEDALFKLTHSKADYAARKADQATQKMRDVDSWINMDPYKRSVYFYQKLIKQGASIDALQTALEALCAKKGKGEDIGGAVFALLDAGAPPTSKALLAVLNHAWIDLKAVKHLLAYGADPKQTDAYGRNAYDFLEKEHSVHNNRRPFIISDKEEWENPKALSWETRDKRREELKKIFDAYAELPDLLDKLDTFPLENKNRIIPLVNEFLTKHPIIDTISTNRISNKKSDYGFFFPMDPVDRSRYRTDHWQRLESILLRRKLGGILRSGTPQDLVTFVKDNKNVVLFHSSDDPDDPVRNRLLGDSDTLRYLHGRYGLDKQQSQKETLEFLQDAVRLFENETSSPKALKNAIKNCLSGFFSKIS